MDDTPQERILAAIDRVCGQLAELRHDLGRPQAELAPRVHHLEAALVTIRQQVAETFAVYRQIEAAIQKATDRSDLLEEQVNHMERQVRILAARVGRMESGDDHAGTA